MAAMRVLRRGGLLVALCIAAAAPAAAAPASASPLPLLPPGTTLPEQTLTLRLNDAIVRPGGVAAAVIRTYASRGVGSGQVCFTVRRSVLAAEVAGGPAITYLGAEVFNPEDDALVRFVPEPDELMLQFAAPLSTINSVDGPLAVIYFRVSGALPGQEYEMAPMLDSFLIDAAGREIPLDLRPGRLRISSPNDPFEITGGAETVVPGDTALLSLQSAELRLLSSGTLALRYDPAIAAGPPTIRVDARHGSVSYDTDGSNPEEGLVVVHFQSPGDDYNRVPGDILEVHLPTRPGIPPGTRSLVRPDLALTVLVDSRGSVLPLSFEAGVLEFVAQ
jgi:hypothetical protein